jgi:3',5'-cyclic AMP phosphodiesterase CpdA
MVEWSGLGELLNPDASEDRAFGSPWVDGGDGVTGAVEGEGQISLPASDLQYPGGRVTDPVEDEPLDASLPPGDLTHATGSRHEIRQAKRTLEWFQYVAPFSCPSVVLL